MINNNTIIKEKIMIAIGCDHGAVELKNQMIEHLKKRGIECKDVGTYTSAANKVKGIRAALCSDCFSAQATREHNNANVLCLGARVIGPELAFRIADTFLDSKFSNDERHIRRISMFD